MLTGRVTSVVFLLVAGVVSLTGLLKGGVFSFIQEFQGYVSPGILAAFVFGFAVKKAPPAAGVAALVASAPLYGLLQWQWGNIPYLHRMLVTFVSLIALMGLITLRAPLKVPRTLPVREELDMRRSPVVYVWGGLLVCAVAVYYFVFP